MSRRKLHFKKILGAKAAVRVEKKKLETHPSGCRGDVTALVSTLPGRVIRNMDGKIGTVPTSERKRELVRTWGGR